MVRQLEAIVPAGSFKNDQLDGRHDVSEDRLATNAKDRLVGSTFRPIEAIQTGKTGKTSRGFRLKRR